MSNEQHKGELIEAIKDWLNSENIPNARRDRENILKFLQGCKFDLEKTKIKMKTFYSVRRSTPKLFQGRDPLNKNIETLLNMGAAYPLPYRKPEDGIIILIKTAVNDPKIIPMADVFKVGIMTVDLMMELDKDVTKLGVRVILDMKGVSFSHALDMSPGLIYTMTNLWQNCYPIKIRSMDFINSPATIDSVLNVFKKFLSEKMQKRIRTHGSELKGLHEVIDPLFLPQEYGGYLGQEKDIFQAWKTTVQNFREWFLNDDTVTQ